MGLSLPIWRKLAATVTALTLALLALGPTFDSLVCGGEGVAGLSLELEASLEETRGDHADHGPEGACLHGHCHHAGWSLAAAVLETDASARQRSSAYPHRRERVADIDRKYGLIRPPRA